MAAIGFVPSKLQRVILFVIQNLGRVPAKIELAKVLYLVDVEGVRLTGETLTGEDYARQKRGPLPWNLTRATDEMDGHEIEIVIEPQGQVGKHEHWPGGDPRFDPNLSDVELLVAGKVVRMVKSLSPREIEALAYDTEPIREIVSRELKLGAQLHGERIDFSLVEQNQRLKRWRENKAKYQAGPDPEYETWLAEERRISEEILNG